ncbi:hypothetical protein M758_3G064900 [Ceratodon purpureus]|uniref:Uncharacterized protein n=1 Tax=Ceratodon purpureus TaxID=3225 RepID=A0A8T0II68_CERPU|nr:hypothetical protein KC19_3G065600 [Ceratodon purpureus]KAG0622003.1 hypothetical protein M758_3G064900 [Ceratodon purpureus]
MRPCTRSRKDFYICEFRGRQQGSKLGRPSCLGLQQLQLPSPALRAASRELDVKKSRAQNNGTTEVENLKGLGSLRRREAKISVERLLLPLFTLKGKGIQRSVLHR